MELMRVIAAAVSQPWAIVPQTGAALWNILCRRAAGVKLETNEIEAIVAARPGHVTPPSTQKAIAVLPIVGVIAHRAAMVEDISGPRGTGTDALTQQLRAALADPDVSAIVFDVDSPGGGVYGVAELAAEIRAARGKKPMVAVANAMAGSAAYWLAAQADELVVTPSGTVGSIGVYSMHQDLSKMLEQKGVATSFIHAGRHKVEGNPFEPLSDEARTKVQADVDTYYAAFVDAVARGRGVSRAVARGEAFGEGRMLLADDAVANGLADRVATLDEVLTELVRGAWVAPARRASDLTPEVVAEIVDVPESLLPTQETLEAIDQAREADASALVQLEGAVERRRRALAHEALR